MPQTSPPFERSVLPSLLRRIRGGRRAWSLYARFRYRPDAIVLAPMRWRGHRFWFGGALDEASEPVFFDPQSYEPGVSEVLSRLLQSCHVPVVLDIGANNGQMLAMTKLLAPNSRVYSFEPFAGLVESCRTIVAANAWSHARVEHAAVTSENHPTEILYSPGELCCATMVKDFRPVGRGIERTVVPGIRLDSFAQRESLSHVDLIKIDVEGGELEVLQGAATILERDHPDLLVEVLPTNAPDPTRRTFRRQRADALGQMLSALGYRCWRVPHDGPLEPLEALVADCDAADSNYLFSVRTAAELVAMGCRVPRVSE